MYINTHTADVVDGLQDFIVCIEMFFAAVAHQYAFNWRDFHDPEKHANMKLVRLSSVVIPHDILNDVKVRARICISIDVHVYFHDPEKHANMKLVRLSSLWSFLMTF